MISDATLKKGIARGWADPLRKMWWTQTPKPSHMVATVESATGV